MINRFRIFAGPNGSGKSTLFEQLKATGQIHTGIYVNADKIEKQIKANQSFNFNAYRVIVNESDFIQLIRNSGLYNATLKDSSFIDKLELKSGILKINLKKTAINSYHASFIAMYLVEVLLKSKQSFCYETVMSHPSKIELLKMAKKAGYKTYLYFLFTDNPELNIERVKLRAKQGLHNVDPIKIKERYYRSFQLLQDAANYSDIAYIIDNSSEAKTVIEKRKNKLIRVIKDYNNFDFSPYLKL